MSRSNAPGRIPTGILAMFGSIVIGGWAAAAMAATPGGTEPAPWRVGLNGGLDFSYSKLRTPARTLGAISSGVGPGSGLTVELARYGPPAALGFKPFVRIGFEVDLLKIGSSNKSRHRLRNGPTTIHFDRDGLLDPPAFPVAQNCRGHQYRLSAGGYHRYGEVSFGGSFSPSAINAAAIDGLGAGYWGSTLVFSQFYSTQLCDALRLISKPLWASFQFSAAMRPASLGFLDVSASRRVGSFFFGTSIQRNRIAGGNSSEQGPDRRYFQSIGAHYTIGRFVLGTSLQRSTSNTLSSPLKNGVRSQAGLSAGYNWRHLRLRLQGYVQKDAQNQAARTASVLLSWRFDKRLSAYVNAAFLKNRGNARFALASANASLIPSAKGQDIKALAIGLKYRFGF